ncbi:ABC transporter permease [Erysipelothrix sp. HDW6C]|uniref:ABC transporter permease n=1 Tax=Erysipelothrix sp. HDW6C TaxID=2714930 RepID=UPI00140CBC01|nr:ABC transporter permease [Erysipelothrix sp. HDW6C]QIK70195.1 ABC transporter permease [Erysipelothrix sp. HDW6C]
MKNKQLSKWIRPVLPSLISIGIGMLIAVIILFFTNPSNAFEGLMRMLKGPFNFGAQRGLGNMLYYATPIMMTGLSVAFAFRTGLFNIGASGQFMVGAFAAIYIGVKWTFIPPQFLWIVSLLAAMIAGALWASLVGFLKAWRNVNEVITSIMMNYIGMYVVMYFIKSLDIYNNLKNETLPVSSHLPKMGMDLLFPGSFADAGIIIALICAVIIYFVLDRTTFGFELKAVGLNRDAAEYAGINQKRSIVLSMIIAGALAGLGGGLAYLAGTGKGIEVVTKLATEGFDGIAVALLGMNNPLGVIGSSFFIAYMKLGGQSMQTIGFVPEIIGMMIGIILYVSALSALFASILAKLKKRSLKKVGEDHE